MWQGVEVGMIFPKTATQGENSFAKEFSPWTPFQKTPIRCGQVGEQMRTSLPAHESQMSSRAAFIQRKKRSHD